MVTPTTYVNEATNPNKKAVAEKPLDRDAFLKLLITQLRNQDPLSPMEDKDFIAQLAQFSSLEQMQNMNKSLDAFLRNQTAFQAVGLIGHTVEGINPKSGDKVSGIVSSIRFEGGDVMLKINDSEIPLGCVVLVR